MSASIELPATASTPGQISLHSKPFIMRLGLGLVIISIICGIASFSIRLGITALERDGVIANALLVANGALVLAMGLLIAWQIYLLWKARQSGQAGAGLHVRLVIMFSLVAVVPTITVAVFATVTLKQGMDTYFSQETRQIVGDALTVAEAYVQEHVQVIGADVTVMASDLDRAYPAIKAKRLDFLKIFRSQTALRGLQASYILGKDNKVDAKVIANKDVEYIPLTDVQFETAKNGKILVIPPQDSNLVRAIIQLKNYDGRFLYAYRSVDPVVVEHLRNARRGDAKYDRLEAQRGNRIWLFALMYTGLALIFLLSAFWFGLWVADRLAAPIGRLIAASLEVAKGDLTVEVPINQSEGDLAAFGRSFNQMTTQLRSQRKDLLDSNTKLDERRRFTEAVLSDVSAGILSVAADGNITLANESAGELMGAGIKPLVGQSIAEVLPEFSDVIAKAISNRRGKSEQNVTLNREGTEHSLLVKVTMDKRRTKQRGYVVTFDDITDLVVAQRTSAWADIARRIAHEIKNPLTPIQLAAERLKRKYAHEIVTDPEVFEKCTETIIRQVGDIGAMVDEFSSFARMPSAVLKREDLGKVIKDSVVLQSVGNNNVKITTMVPDEPVMVMIDRRLMTQVLTNLVKNATESIEARALKEHDTDYQGVVEVRLETHPNLLTLDVIDNGVGLPKAQRQRLVEPYMTTREKGTGLGLAIVKKIIEEHGGTLHLQDTPYGDVHGTGAMLRLELPLQEVSRSGTEIVTDEQKSTGGKKKTAKKSKGPRKVSAVEEENS